MKLTLRIWILAIYLIISLISIVNFHALVQNGVEIKNIEQNSSAITSGLKQGDIIISVNNNPVQSLADYSREINLLFKDKTECIKVVINTKENQFVFC